MVWVKMSPTPEEEEIGDHHHDFDTRQWLGVSEELARTDLMPQNRVQGGGPPGGPDNGIFVSRPRRAITDATTQALTRGGTASEYFGSPLLAFKLDRPSRTAHADMNMQDVRYTIDAISTFYRDDRARAQPELESKYSIAIQVSHDPAKPRAQVVLDGADGAWCTASSPIANLLGLPLGINKINFTQGYNEVAARLTLDVFSSTALPPQGPLEAQTFQAQLRVRHRAMAGTRGFGTRAAIFDRSEVGDVKIVRHDGKPLLTQHLEALLAYIETEIEPRLESAISGLENGAEIPERAQILRDINRHNFEQFWRRYQSAKAADSDLELHLRWADLPSPYDPAREYSNMRPSIDELLAKQKSGGYVQLSDIFAKARERGWRADGDYDMDEVSMNVPDELRREIIADLDREGMVPARKPE